MSILDRDRDTYADDHPPNDLVVSDEIGVLALRLEEAVKKVFLALANIWIFLHALHEAFDAEAGGDGEVVEFVKGARPARVLAEPVVESGDLADLFLSVYVCSILKLRCLATRSGIIADCSRKLTTEKYRITRSAVPSIPPISLACSMNPNCLLHVMCPRKSHAKYEIHLVMSQVLPLFAPETKRASSCVHNVRRSTFITSSSWRAFW